MFPAADSQQAGATASWSSSSLGINTSNTNAAQPGPPTKQQRLTAIFAVISSLQGSYDTRTSVAQHTGSSSSSTSSSNGSTSSSSGDINISGSIVFEPCSTTRAFAAQHP